ncbi:MAG: GNAT family N-acetyltransferase [Sulfolobales archaeon]
MVLLLRDEQCKDLIIRRAGISDAEGIYKMYSLMSEEDLYRRFLYIKRPSKEEIEAYLRDPRCVIYIAEICGMVVGEGFLHRSGEIAIIVHPDFRGRGIGKRIFASLYKEARKMNIEKLFFYTSPHNIPVIRIAIRFGCRLRIVEGLYMGVIDICPETDNILREILGEDHAHHTFV